MEAIMATTSARVRASTAIFGNILFATDFSSYSRQALPYVGSLARTFGSKVFLCHVVTASQLIVGAPEAAPYLYEAEWRNSEEMLRAMARLPELQGVKTEAVLSSGLLEDELTQSANRNNID